MKITIQEIDDQGNPLEWIAESSEDLVAIAEELLTEFEAPKILHAFKKIVRNQTNLIDATAWLVKQLNKLNDYKYGGCFE